MKVVDMFGAGIPVLAIDFPALPELVKNERNGYIFTSKEQLSLQLTQLSEDRRKLKELKEGVKKEGEHNWSQEWNSKFPKKWLS